MRTSEHLQVGQVYTRKRLQALFGIRDATIRTGIFRPQGHDSIWLFITREKSADRTPYRDQLSGDDLHCDGQTSGRSDSWIINHERDGVELLLFHRHDRHQYEGAGFVYEGRFRYVSHTGGQPAHFHLRRVHDSVRTGPQQQAAQAADGPAEHAVGQGFSGSPQARKAVENHAMRVATEHFAGQGFSVQDVSGSRPYDLHCVRGAEVLHVEVKGTTTPGGEILLTRGEVLFAQQHWPHTALFLLHSVAVQDGGGSPEASGGVVRVLRPWRPSDDSLTPTGYVCTLPAQENRTRPTSS